MCKSLVKITNNDKGDSMNEVWHVFIDVDGTLVDYNNDLPQSAVTAIKAARAKGHKVYAVTGRSKAEMYEDILAIGLDGYIGGNGNYIEANGEALMHLALPVEDVKNIINWLHNKGLEYYVEANSGLYASANFRERGKSTMREYVLGKGGQADETFTVDDAFPHMIYGADPIRDDVNKISFILESYDDYLQAKEKFSDFQVNTWGGQGEHALFGDVARGGINKQTALTFLEENYDLNPEYTMAFGDANVDIPMLEYAKIGVAMGSGGDSIKAMADYVTDAVADDGLYNAFKHFGLID